MNKNELIKRLKELESAHQVDDYSEGFDDGIVVALDLADRLDEPEVLSEEWVSDNAVVGQYPNGIGYVVPVDELYGKILPKQELPVIPPFVAKWIEDYKEKGYSGINAVFNIVSGAEDLYMEEYLRENLRTFIDAWDNGYTVEEKKYEVLDNENSYLLVKKDAVLIDASVVFELSNVDFYLTEQEIKDYDERFWAFAVPVEEEDECLSGETADKRRQ